MAKKKTKPTSRVSPPIDKTPPKYVQYDDLQNGAAFLYAGALLMKCENSDQEAIDLDTGHVTDCMCEYIVEPVDITIKWSRK